MGPLDLASAFPPATREAWRAAAERALKGADFDRALVGRTADGIRIEPLYGKAESPPALPGRVASPWRVAARMDHPDPGAANALALADLEGGADALTLTFAGAGAARGFGLVADDVDALDRALDGVMLDLVSLRLEAGPSGPRHVATLVALAERRRHRPSELDLDLGLDPVGGAARDGKLPASWREDLAACLHGLAGQGFTGRLASADGRPYHEAGASEGQELAAVLATGVAYLRALEAGGHDLGAARDAISFLLVADADEFLSVAKFRALRRLWARVETACGLDPVPVRLHAETAWRMLTRRDPWVNLLRGTLAAFSAGIGGADSVSVLPFTAALGLPDAFARRLARNTQIVLLEEANLWRVADPVAGSGGFEALTTELCETAWTLFGDIEREGGIAASLGSGAVQRRIAATRARRETAVATRREPIVGTSEFADLREMPVEVLRPSPAPKAVAVAGSDDPGSTRCEPLPSRRLAEPFERLRDASDASLARSGARPRVFLANLGPVAAFTARSTFARNAFETGGIEAVTNEGFGSVDDLATAFLASEARIACLCSSDAVYETEADAAAAALKAAGAGRIFLAGRPGGNADALRVAGVDGFVHAGCDLPAILGDLLDGAGA